MKALLVVCVLLGFWTAAKVLAALCVLGFLMQCAAWGLVARVPR